ncbi:NmrA family NAD(P)-binding protein [Streptomyces afghaniensis]|uniref:NmrA family NAD(P)-binding protein n=1 Tax=Streptomyces afghaniensis TaxID=66865 RepID=UPI0037968917
MLETDRFPSLVAYGQRHSVGRSSPLIAKLMQRSAPNVPRPARADRVRTQPLESKTMSSHATSTIFVIGGTGAQGMPIVRALVADKKYSVRVLTRDATSPRAQELLALGNVSILEGSFADEDVLREGFRSCDGAFVNIDGFNTGEKTETYWNHPQL